MTKRVRLDELLISRGLAADARAAFILVIEGRVRARGQKAVSPAQKVETDVKIEISPEKQYVGRGAYKLEAALEYFDIEVEKKICADIGAATGGFTDVLLKRGAKKVYAIDTARGKLALKLREDPRVTVMEQTDVRDVARLPESADIAAIDVSLIPLRGILPHVRRLLKPEGEVIALLKPQYETRDPKILRHGIVAYAGAREKLLEEFISWAEENGWEIAGRMESPIRGGKGNVEYLLHLVPIT